MRFGLTQRRVVSAFAVATAVTLPTGVSATAAALPKTRAGIRADGPATPPRLRLSKRLVTTHPLPGARLTYTFTVRNVGLVPAYQVVLSDFMPSGLTATSVTGRGCRVVVGQVRCRWARVPYRRQITVSLTARLSHTAKPGATLANTATLRYRGFATRSFTTSSTAAATIAQPPPPVTHGGAYDHQSAAHPGVSCPRPLPHEASPICPVRPASGVSQPQQATHQPHQAAHQHHHAPAAFAAATQSDPPPPASPSPRPHTEACSPGRGSGPVGHCSCPATGGPLGHGATSCDCPSGDHHRSDVSPSGQRPSQCRPSARLPHTGVDIWPLVALSLTALAGGITLLRARSRFLR